jgi:hypothetical protein
LKLLFGMFQFIFKLSSLLAAAATAWKYCRTKTLLYYFIK